MKEDTETELLRELRRISNNVSWLLYLLILGVAAAAVVTVWESMR